MDNFSQSTIVNLSATPKNESPSMGAGSRHRNECDTRCQDEFSYIHVGSNAGPDTENHLDVNDVKIAASAITSDTKYQEQQLFRGAMTPQEFTDDEVISQTTVLVEPVNRQDSSDLQGVVDTESTRLEPLGKFIQIRQNFNHGEKPNGAVSQLGYNDAPGAETDAQDGELKQLTDLSKIREHAGSKLKSVEFVPDRSAGLAAFVKNNSAGETPTLDTTQLDIAGSGKIEQTALPSAERPSSPMSQLNIAPSPGAIREQIIAAISVKGDKTNIEITLDPPELGRITIDFEGNGKGLVRGVIAAESAQTIDILRRNLDILQRELASNGFGNIDLQMGERDTGRTTRGTAESENIHFSNEISGDVKEGSNSTAYLIPDGRLDRRI